jgi:glutathione S-transferase
MLYVCLCYSCEVINVNLKYKPEWFLEMNPLGKVPTLEYNGTIIYESAVCNEWLDDTFPDKQVQSTDPTHRAQQKMLTERLSKV